MAKKIEDIFERQHRRGINRSVEYAEMIRRLFEQTVTDIVGLQSTDLTLAEGEMFSFDALPIKTQQEVERLLRRLHSVATTATENKIEIEWEKANEEIDRFVESKVGKEVIDNPKFKAWTARNTTALYTFMIRKQGNKTLSERIWSATRQLREEMEVAMTVSIGEGKSAAQMSREVKKYLNDPDLMFRRFRYKIEDKIVEDKDADGNVIGTHKETVWGRKWKKLVKDENGRKHWIDYDKDSYKVGSGMYKSATKNAMRVTRTETNMAYRRADQERWQKLDFVLGYHIQPSANHTEEDCEPDICEQLKGDYPKTFKFTGWHIQCLCFSTPILMSDDEYMAMMDAKAQGKPYKSPRLITDYPQGFKDWCVENADKIEDLHKRGKDPYFVRENWKVVKDIEEDEE